jgi:hypothetical protein
MLATIGVRNKVSLIITVKESKDKGKVAHVHAIKEYRGMRSVAPLILNLCTRWCCMINFTSKLVYLSGRIPVPIK